MENSSQESRRRRKLERLILLGVAGTLFGLVLYGYAALLGLRSEPISPTPLGKSTTLDLKINLDTKIYDTSAKKLSLQQLVVKNKKTLLILWATWCAPCTRELPVLLKLKKDFDEKNIELLLVNYDDPVNGNKELGVETVKKWMQQQELSSFKLYFDFDKILLDSLRLAALPAAVFLDDQGTALDFQRGEVDWASWLEINFPKITN